MLLHGAVGVGVGGRGNENICGFIIFMAQYLGKEGSLSKHQEANVIKNTLS